MYSCLLQQNPLETLCLLAGETEKIKDEFIDLAISGKVVELAAMIIVAEEKFFDFARDILIHCESLKERSVIDKDRSEKLDAVLCLVEMMRRAGSVCSIQEYIREDKYGVSKCSSPSLSHLHFIFYGI